MDRLVLKYRSSLASLLLASGVLLGQAASANETSCDNEALTGFDGLLVLAPHPDDEMLGFAGLVDAFRRQGKPVRVVVVTDGDAYCDACTLWKNGAILGPGCDALELSNLATPEVDSFAEVRRGESTAAAAMLGLPAPQFLGYPDTGLAAAWAAREAGSMETPLHRSDFSACNGCGECAGYGVGPQLELSASTLKGSLDELLDGTSPRTLVATTHWLDGHGDHAALGQFTRAQVAGMSSPRAVAYAVIHAHTPKETPHPDCWYPGPGAAECPCMDPQRAVDEPRWWDAQRLARIQPGSPASLPDDAEYGAGLQLCLDAELLEGEQPKKLSVIQAYRSQLGLAGRDGDLPEELAGILDCNGYLASFARRTEVFVLEMAGPD